MKTLREVVSSHPDKNAQRLGLSVVYLLEENDDKLIECLELLIASHPKVLIFQRWLAEVYISRQEYTEAIAYLEKVAKLNKHDFAAMIWLALCYFETSEMEKGGGVFKILREHIYLLRVSSNNWT